MRMKNVYRAGMIAFMASALFCATSAIRADDCSPCEPLCEPCEPQCGPCDSACGDGSGTLLQAVFGAGPYYRPGRDLYGSPNRSSNGSRQDSVFGGNTGNLARTAAVAATATAVPNMIGDTSNGGCGGIVFGGALAATMAHPTFACSRLNIAESNSAEVQNRIYYNYRHFDSASNVDAFSYSPLGKKRSIDIDRHTIGLEKKIARKTSLEVRVPILYQLTSDIAVTQYNNTGVPMESFPGIDDLFKRDTDLGNISLIFKRELVNTKKFILSGGVGLNLPTSPDVNFNIQIDDNAYVLLNPPGTTGLEPTIPINANLRGRVKNETVNIQPFIAYRWTPNKRLFGHGFFQIDIPANGSDGSIDSNIVANAAIFPPVSASGKLYQQTIMRLNAGGGYWLYRNERADWLKGIAGILEFHWTSTLNDSALVGPVNLATFDLGPGATKQLDLTIGNLRNRVDVVNCVAGVPIQIGKTMVSNSLCFPVSTNQEHRGFDWEYSLSVERRF